MVKRMMTVSGISLVLMAVFWGIFILGGKRLFYTLGIISLTVCYHFSVRLVIGGLIDYNMKNQVDYTKKWFSEKEFEKNFYRKLHVKKWKDNLPTADEELFSLKTHTIEEIIMAGCQAEIVHWFCAAAGFLTMFLAIPFGDWYIFLITSVLAAAYDMLFVIIQRYNRPRLMKTLGMEKRLTEIKKENKND